MANHANDPIFTSTLDGAKDFSGGANIIVDHHYTLSNGEIVAVELKHAKDVPTKQLEDRIKALADENNKIARFEYVFSNQTDALNNQDKLKTAFGDFVKIYYVDGTGLKQIK